MFRKTIILLSLFGATLAGYEESKYYRTPPPPRILSHKQSQLHDGGFKFAFAAENGLAQTEVIAPDGTRSGGYTYVDPHGKTITVKYTAGKDGFRILEGAHIPREVAAHPADRQQAHYEHDDGSYKPERDEHPYDDQPAAGGAHRAPAPLPQPAQQPQYKASYAQPQYSKAYAPQAQPRHYAPPVDQDSYSNSVESHGHGPGYSFHIQN